LEIDYLFNSGGGLIIKLKSKIIFISLIIVILLSISAVSASQIDNLTQKNKISSTNSDELLSDENDASLINLSNDISASGSSLDLSKNYVYNSTKDTDIPNSGIKIENSIIIDGKGYSIDAGNSKRIFQISSSNVLLKNINFINGFHNDNGGAVLVDSGLTNITFENCFFTNNHANNQGGAIHASSQLKIDNCNFTLNQVTTASTSVGGSVYINTENCVIINSRFNRNTANYGGAIYIHDQNLTINNCNFTSNTGLLYGGAINDGTNVRSYNILNSYFFNNTSLYGGSSINSNGGISTLPTCIINQCTFINNRATSTSYNNARGGTVRNVGSGMLINNSHFENNTATSLVGGGVLFTQSTTGYNSIINSNFTNNSAANGGATFISTPNSKIINVIYINNHVGNSNYGGAIYINGANGNISNSTFINNTAGYGAIHSYSATSIIYNCTFLRNSAIQYGGAISLNAASKVIGCLFLYNKAPGGSALYSSAANANLSNSIILNNIATGSYNYTVYSTGGLIFANDNWWGNTLNDKSIKLIKSNGVSLDRWYFLDICATPTRSLTNIISNVTITLNHLSGADGIISLGKFKYPNQINLNLSSTTYSLPESNITLNENHEYNLTLEIGDLGVYNLMAQHSNINAVKKLFHVPEDSISALNITLANASGMLNLTHNYKYYDEFDEDFIENCIDINKVIYINGNGFTIDGKNKIRVMDITADKVTITNLTFVNGSASEGGAICWKGSNGVLKYSIFKNNYATTQAGAVLWRGVNGTIDYCNFTNNIANGNHWAAGAVGWYGDYGLINNSNFIENGASNVNSGNAGDAGALAVFNCHVNIDNSLFSKNYASDKGGALGVDSGAYVDITNTIFKDNYMKKASGLESLGGAIYFYLSINRAFIKNCSFINNSASGNGGGIHTDSPVTILSSLFINNIAPGGPLLYSENKKVNISDCIILNHTVPNSGSSIVTSTNGGYITANNNWWGNTLQNKNVNPITNGKTTINNWYFLNIETNVTYLLKNGVCNVTFGLDLFRKSDSSISHRKLDNELPKMFNYTVNMGNLSKSGVILSDLRLDNATYFLNETGVVNITLISLGVKSYKLIYYVPDDSFTALNMSLDNATDVLNLTHDYKYYDEFDFAFLGTGIKIDKKITIQGNNHTIDAKNKLRIFYVSADDVTLNNLTLINGHAANGGSIYWYGKNGLLTNSNLNAHSVTTRGGAVYWYGEHGSINLCNFTNNQADGLSWTGGAVYWIGHYGLINNSNFKNNSALKYGSTDAGDCGALSLCAKYIVVDNCNFTENNCANGGGAISTTEGQYVNITNSIFTNNGAKKSSSSSAQGIGGAIYMNSPDFYIYNCIFINNFASNNAGAIRTSARGSIVSSIFFNNTSPTGSVLHATASGVNISDCIFLNNKATSSTGYIISSDTTNRVTADNNWWGNTLNNQKTRPAAYSDVILSHWYFLNIESNVTFLLKNGVCNVTFRLDQVSDSNGVLTQRNFNNVLPVVFNYTVNKGNLSKFSADVSDLRYDNAIYFFNETGVANITLQTLAVTAYKLIYYVPDDSFTALNMSLANATDVLNLTHDYKYYDEFDFAFLGTGIKIDKKITIQGNNHTIDAKSKVRVFYVTADEVTLNNLTLINGNADNGGAIYWVGNYGILNNSNVIKNFASLQGGGIFWAGHYGILDYSNITENWANGRGWTGGGIHWNGNYGIINHTTFDGNRAEYYDSADAGDAAGLAFSGKYLAIDYSRFIRSYGIQCGGAIGANHDAQYLNVTNTLFENNTAYKKSRNFDAEGAAFYLGKNLVKVVIYNCTFIGNKASNRGGVILSSSPVEMTSCFFKGNSANSGQVAAAYSSLSIVDSILLDNGNGYIFVSDSGTKVTANYNWFGNTVNNQKSRPSVSGTTLNYWYFLNLESNATLLLPNEVCKITARLDQVTTSAGVVSERRLNYPLPNVFNFTATIGNLDYYSIILNETRCVNNTFVTTVPGYCTVTVEALGKIASIKISYVPNDSFTALDMLINKNYGSNLNLTHDYQYYQEFDSSFVSAGIKITAPINITGNGYSLKAKSKLRIFYITGNNVNIDGINFMNGYCTGIGGAIYIEGQYVNITNSNITSSSAWSYGGGADVVSNYVSFVNVSFKSNKVRVGSDKTNNYGGGALTIHNTAAYCSLIGCEFKSNYASESGGAILWSGPNGIVKDTYFESNNAQKYDGGAIYAKSSAINLLIDNITAYKNKDGGYGSAIASFATGTLINNSKFISNDYNNARKYGATVYFAAARGKIYNSYFEKNRAYNGGAISTQSWNSEIKNVTFIGNRAVNLGGAINIQGSPSNINISDCSFNGNYAGTTGGAIRVTSTKTSGLAITNSSFKNNHAYRYGGAISVQSAGAKITGCYFDNNYVSKYNGGALDLNGANIIVDNSTFNNNRGIYGGAIAWFKSGGKLTNSVFTNNRATGHDGAGLFVASGASNMYVCNVTMKDNVAKYAGSAIHSDATNTKIYNSTFTQNRNDKGSYGGTICFYKTGGYVYGCNFTKNNNFFGGGIYTRNRAYSITVEKCNFIQNRARSSGGGIHVTKNTRVTVIDSNFIGNYAKTCGGDVDTYGYGTYIVNSTFINSSSPRGGS